MKRSGKQHRHSAGAKTPTYRSWKAMRHRVRTHARYKDISICERWSSYILFLEDMGERPEGTTLDRINSCGNYDPANCRWATIVEQSSNRKDNKYLTVNEETNTQAEWARRWNLSPSTMCNRLKAGWALDRIMNTPMKVNNKYES